MIFDGPFRHPDAVPFFVSPPAWVLINEAATGELRVATECDDGGRAILCFLSPLDALIEAARFSQFGEAYYVMSAAQLDGGLFHDADGCGLVACVHLGWPTQDGRILTRPGGAFGRYARTVHIWADDPPWFEVDPATLAALDDLHERAGQFAWRAGQFAWRETHCAIREWEWARLYEAAKLALHTAPVSTVDEARCDGIALFDPEFEQWHSVARPEVSEP